MSSYSKYTIGRAVQIARRYAETMPNVQVAEVLVILSDEVDILHQQFHTLESFYGSINNYRLKISKDRGKLIRKIRSEYDER